jgi:hypothetical protein
LIGDYGALLGTLRELKNAEEQRAAVAKSIAESGAALDREAEEARERARQEIELKFRLDSQLLAIEVEKLRVAGLTDVAQKVELENLIKLNEQRKVALERANVNRPEGELAEAQNKINLLKVQRDGLQELKRTTIDVGKAVADTLTDIATGMATGTLKGFDIVKAAGAAMIHLVSDIFRQTLAQKLSFEVNLLNNVRGLPQQLNGAFVAGAGAIPGSGAAGGAPTGGGIGGFFGNLFSNAPGFSLNGGLLGGGIGALLGLPALFSGGFTGPNVGGALGGIGGGVLGSFFGPIGSVVGSFLGNILGKLFGGLFGGGVPKSRGNLSTTFGGISLGPLGLELGDIDTTFGAKGPGSKEATGFGDKANTAISGTLGSIIDILNTLPRAILEKLPLDSVTAAIEREGSFNFKVRSTKFDDFLEDLLASMPARLIVATLPLLQEGLTANVNRVFGTKQGEPVTVTVAERLRELDDELAARHRLPGPPGFQGIGTHSPEADAILTQIQALQGRDAGEVFATRIGGQIADQVKGLLARIAPPRGFPGDNEPLIKMAEASLEAFESIFDLVNKLEPVLEFASQRERTAIEGGFGSVLAADSPEGLKKSVERFIKTFSAEFQASEARRQLGFSLAESLVAGFNQIDARTAFGQFQKGFADVIKQTMQQAIVESFVLQNLQPLLVGPLAGITDILSQIGQGKTSEQALGEAQPFIDLLAQSVQGLQPIFLALIEMVRKLDTRIETSLGVPASGGGPTSINISINGNVNSTDDAREIADRLGRLFEASLPPGALV